MALMKICKQCNVTSGVALFTDLLNILLLFLSLSFTFFIFLVTFLDFLPLAPSTSPGSTCEFLGVSFSLCVCGMGLWETEMMGWKLMRDGLDLGI